MPKLFRSPGFWLAAFVVWTAVLFFLSGRTGEETKLPPIPYSDKVCHFGYFFGGGGLIGAFFYCLRPRYPRWGRIILQVAIVIGLIGIIDEYHQTFTPGRSGNDPLDWTADVLGGICGGLVFKRFHRALKHPVD
jgi:VanZ family protein